MHTICEVPAKKIVRDLINSEVSEMHDKHGKAAFYTLCDGDIQHEYQLHKSLKNLNTMSFNFDDSICNNIENAFIDKLPAYKAKRAKVGWGDINLFCRNEAAEIRNGKKSKTDKPRFFWFDYCWLAKKAVYRNFINMVSEGWTDVAVTDDCQIAVTFKVGARNLLKRGNWLDKNLYEGCQNDANSIKHWHEPTQASLRAEFIAKTVLSDCSEYLSECGWRCKRAVMYQSTTDRMMTIFFDRKDLTGETEIEMI